MRETTAVPVTVRPAGRPRIAVWKFASCDGCQLSLLDCERELLAVAGAVDLVMFPEASSAMAPGPYDISFVEGSITTEHDAERIRAIRDQSGLLVTLGACATAGGIQALRNLADLGDLAGAVYPSPELLSALPTSTPIMDHVAVDAELRGCPIDRGQLLEVINAVLNGRPPRIATVSVCVECKRKGIGRACCSSRTARRASGPVTHGGCERALPRVRPRVLRLLRPEESPNVASLTAIRQSSHGPEDRDVHRFNAEAGIERVGDPSCARRCRNDRDDRTSSTGARAGARPRRGRGRMHVRMRDGEVTDVRLRSTSRRGSSRRSCAGARSASRSTSPRASAGSARSPTR
jgi:sulfhydrogenase subunit delta